MSKHKNPAKRALYTGLTCSFAGLAVVFLFINSAKPSLKPSGFVSTSAQVFQDSLVENRHFGLVALDRFLDLASRLACFDAANTENFSKSKDSVTITLSSRDNIIFFGDYSNYDDMTKLANNYRNFPITVNEKGTSFTAELVMGEDERTYIRIPYFILASLAKEVEPQRVEPNKQPKVFSNLIASGSGNTVELEDGQIETGNLVAKNFNDIIANHGRKSMSDEKKLEIVWQFVKRGWNSVHNSNSSQDTWRSASETICDYYQNGKRYMGDCEDFAILMASFARQAGFDSRCVCIRTDEGEYMYAEFSVEGKNKWKPLDNTASFKGTPREGKVLLYYK